MKVFVDNLQYRYDDDLISFTTQYLPHLNHPASPLIYYITLVINLKKVNTGNCRNWLIDCRTFIKRKAEKNVCKIHDQTKVNRECLNVFLAWKTTFVTCINPRALINCRWTVSSHRRRLFMPVADARLYAKLTVSQTEENSDSRGTENNIFCSCHIRNRSYEPSP